MSIYSLIDFPTELNIFLRIEYKLMFGKSYLLDLRIYSHVQYSTFNKPIYPIIPGCIPLKVSTYTHTFVVNIGH